METPEPHHRCCRRLSDIIEQPQSAFAFFCCSIKNIKNNNQKLSLLSLLNQDHRVAPEEQALSYCCFIAQVIRSSKTRKLDINPA